MRLLNTESLKFKEFFGPDEVEYAILSHRWGTLEEEVSYEDFVEGRKRDTPGWKKIEKCAEVAALKKLSWMWIDTCCIDKRSSAELSEAINSMYRWYKDSTCCVAYLADVLPEDRANWRESFGASKWFERGWTLQELIAPRSLTFYNADWTAFGDKSALKATVSAITNIDLDVLSGNRFPGDMAAVTIFAWAAQRKTTRIEDKAYCLLGLLGINMPLLYGEGEKAFRRLQLQVIDEHADLSLLAFPVHLPEDKRLVFNGLLAPRLVDFKSCKNINLSVTKSFLRAAHLIRLTLVFRQIILPHVSHIFGYVKNYYMAELPTTQDGRACYVALAHAGSGELFRIPQSSLTLPINIWLRDSPLLEDTVTHDMLAEQFVSDAWISLWVARQTRFSRPPSFEPPALIY